MAGTSVVTPPIVVFSDEPPTRVLLCGGGAYVSGAEAFLSLGKQFRVEVSDEVLSGLEKIFGEQVAELR